MPTKIYNKKGFHIGSIDLSDTFQNIEPDSLTEQELKDINNSEPFYTKESLPDALVVEIDPDKKISLK